MRQLPFPPARTGEKMDPRTPRIVTDALRVAHTTHTAVIFHCPSYEMLEEIRLMILAYPWPPHEKMDIVTETTRDAERIIPRAREFLTGTVTACTARNARGISGPLLYVDGVTDPTAGPRLFKEVCAPLLSTQTATVIMTTAYADHNQEQAQLLWADAENEATSENCLCVINVR
jgi:hypothetical protein